MRLNFIKMQGCGNDFLFLDYMNSEPPVFYEKEIRFFCNRNFGYGADGFVVLRSTPDAHAKWDFYNSDGSAAEMCGNAARCAIRYIVEKYHPHEVPILLETKAGIIKGKKINNEVIEVAMMAVPEGRFQYDHKVIKYESGSLDVFIVNTGVPHAVLEVKDIKTYPIRQVGAFLLKHPVFGIGGTNVTFFEKQNGPRIFSTTYERGVEDETLACGTGACAAAIVASEIYLEPIPIDVEVPGGLLRIDMSPASRMLLLQGPAEYVYELEINDYPNFVEEPRRYSDRRKKT